MWTRFKHLRRDERGVSLVFVATSFMAFTAATTFAIDVGMLMTARTQAQNAADAGALAGAIALYYNDFNNRSASGPAVLSAINAARSNSMLGAAPSVIPADVTFPNDPFGKPTRVQVQAQRSTARGNSIPTLTGTIFRLNNANIGATAVAEASKANAETCVKPFTIPDRWQEMQTGPWDPSDSFDMYDSKGALLPNPDVYRGPDDPNYTGYDATRDKGLQIVLKANNTLKVTASFYNPWDLPGSIGASDYSNNIATCNTQRFGFGANMPPENGNMVGPTKQGVDALVAQDPNAIWDTSCNCVKGSAYGVSPRVVTIPLYDPVAFADGAAHGKNIVLKVVNYLGFFIEKMTSTDVTGRITPISGSYDNSAGPAPAGAFPVVIRLVQ